jgi:acyl-[acyl carrier protein]--UDP-N-acetylglucosamine O-acyltransferase
LAVAVAVANVNVLRTIVEKIVNPFVEFPNLIDPDTQFMDFDSFKIGKGNIIGQVSRMAINVQFGDFNIVVNDCVFGHDDVVGNYNVFYPAVRLSGHVTCGDCNMFGVRSTVLQGITVGNHVKLAMGSFLMNDASDGFVYKGNPARKIGM